jgi:hypothetical protein
LVNRDMPGGDNSWLACLVNNEWECVRYDSECKEHEDQRPVRVVQRGAFA